MSADLRARIAELEAELAEAKADGERGWADAQRREDDGAIWAKTSRRFHEEWKAAEAELEQWRACFGETALKDARGVLAERDQLRAAVERVAKQLDYLDLLITTMGRHNPTTGGIFAKTSGKIRAALDQAPAAEQETDRRRILRELTQDAVEAGTYGEPAPAAERDGGSDADA